MYQGPLTSCFVGTRYLCIIYTSLGFHVCYTGSSSFALFAATSTLGSSSPSSPSRRIFYHLWSAKKQIYRLGFMNSLPCVVPRVATMIHKTYLSTVSWWCIALYLEYIIYICSISYSCIHVLIPGPLALCASRTGLDKIFGVFWTLLLWLLEVEGDSARAGGGGARSRRNGGGRGGHGHYYSNAYNNQCNGQAGGRGWRRGRRFLFLASLFLLASYRRYQVF